MIPMSTLEQKLTAGEYDAALSALYGPEALSRQRERYQRAAASFAALYGSREQAALYSAPGRTELIGNHTDHHHGQVLAASIDLDIIAVAAPREDGCICIHSEGYSPEHLKLDDLSPHPEEVNRSLALLRGTAARFAEKGYAIGGFDAYITSAVPKGAGLSSSAAFEVLIGLILSTLYNQAALSAGELARIAQYTENVYFGKPSGLMDQMACAVGGVISLDFADETQPVVRPLSLDPAAAGYRLCLVDTGGSHADLTQEYAAVPREMAAVAAALGVRYLRETSRAALLSRIAELRDELGDRAVLRALHFFSENERVETSVRALQAGDFHTFLQMVLQSGHSSFEYLQSVYASSDVRSQGLSLALCLAQNLLEGQGAWRVHGGGFGGTTLNVVPVHLSEEFRSLMEGVFGSDACHFFRIRPYGGICLDTLKPTTI